MKINRRNVAPFIFGMLQVFSSAIGSQLNGESRFTKERCFFTKTVINIDFTIKRRHQVRKDCHDPQFFLIIVDAVWSYLMKHRDGDNGPKEETGVVAKSIKIQLTDKC